MIRHFAFFRAHTLALLAVVLFVPLVAYGQTEPVDLTASFVKGGITVDRLLVYQIGGVVLIRGRTGDPLMAEEAGRFAARAGYRRVANLIEVVPELADEALVRRARHVLEMEPQLQGCHFRIESAHGVIQIRGDVTREIQKDLAARLIGRIDGVKEVRNELALSAPAATGGSHGSRRH